MKASKQSFHAYLYELTYKDELPQNLCPYFWKLVWAAVIFIPNMIIQAPSRILSMILKEEEDCAEHRGTGFAMWMTGVIAFVYVICTYHWIKAMFGAYSYNDGLANFGILANVILLLVVVGAIIQSIADRRKELLDEGIQLTGSTILVDFIVSKYNRYCPKIDWDK